MCASTQDTPHPTRFALESDKQTRPIHGTLVGVRLAGGACSRSRG